MPPLGRLYGYARKMSIERSGERDRHLATIEVQILGPVTRAASEPETLRLLVTDPELIQRWRAAHTAPTRLRITIDEDPLEPMEERGTRAAAADRAPRERIDPRSGTMRPTPRRCPCPVYCVRVMRGWLRAFRNEPDAWADMILNGVLGAICEHGD